MQKVNFAYVLRYIYLYRRSNEEVKIHLPAGRTAERAGHIPKT